MGLCALRSTRCLHPLQIVVGVLDRDLNNSKNAETYTKVYSRGLRNVDFRLSNFFLWETEGMKAMAVCGKEGVKRGGGALLRARIRGLGATANTPHGTGTEAQMPAAPVRPCALAQPHRNPVCWSTGTSSPCPALCSRGMGARSPNTVLCHREQVPSSPMHSPVH